MSKETPMEKAANSINEASREGSLGGNGEKPEEHVGLKMDETSFYKIQWLVAAREKARFQVEAKNHQLNEVRMAAQRKIANAEVELRHAKDEENQADQRYHISIREFEEEMRTKLDDPDFKLMYWIIKDDMSMEPSPLHPLNQVTPEDTAEGSKQEETTPG